MSRWQRWRAPIALLLITLGGLWLRWLAWRWNAARPLGGDEREYFEQALAIARGAGYHDLLLMRPPLFSLGLALLAILTDSSITALRLLNALVSTATIPLMYWWTRTLLPQLPRRVPLLAATLTAAWYTLALNATELLTETVTLAGLLLAFTLLVRTGRRAAGPWRGAALAGVTVALVCLVRSVALPLLPLGALWLWRGAAGAQRGRRAVIFLLAALLTITPWTIRNALTYHGFIFIDTTGPENLWLDNDPAGREAVKAQLYALGDDRVARSKLATQQGLQALTSHPGWVLQKSWREFRRFWAFEHTDDLLARPAIWVPPSEAWLRVVLGDVLWFVLLLAGAAGLLLLPLERGLRSVLALWALYTVFTGALFHVEYRYRLPLVPVLLPAAAWSLAYIRWRRTPSAEIQRRRWSRPSALAALALVLALALFSLSYAAYPATTVRLIRKHWSLWRAEVALADPTPPPTGAFIDTLGSGIPVYTAEAKAAQALKFDPDSVLARVLQARAALRLHETERAEQLLRTAIAQLPAHPYPHLLLGDLLRARGDLAAARTELAFETASREDLQRWAQLRFSQTPPPAQLELGAGLDLGFIHGFYAAEPDATRWFADQASVTLAPPQSADTLSIRVAAPRPAGLPAPQLTILINGQPIFTQAVGPDWQTIDVPLPAPLDPVQSPRIELRASTQFVPHAYDRTNPDGRALGVRVDSLGWR